MSISEAEVRRMARLARLDLSDAEVARLGHDLAAILAYAERLGPVPETEEEPRAETAPGPLRGDREEPWLAPGEATAPAPGASEGLFRVPPAVEGR